MKYLNPIKLIVRLGDGPLHLMDPAFILEKSSLRVIFSHLSFNNAIQLLQINISVEFRNLLIELFGIQGNLVSHLPHLLANHYGQTLICLPCDAFELVEKLFLIFEY
jgi:hypothetical protein